MPARGVIAGPGMARRLARVSLGLEYWETLSWASPSVTRLSEAGGTPRASLSATTRIISAPTQGLQLQATSALQTAIDRKP